MKIHMVRGQARGVLSLVLNINQQPWEVPSGIEPGSHGGGETNSVQTFSLEFRARRRQDMSVVG